MGIDPGITTGIAILDANGNVLDVYSKRDMNKGEIIRRIVKFGKPIVISSDVSITPKSVEKIATKLGSMLYSPETSPSSNEKKNLTKDYYASVKNDHENDALFAAIKAWKYHRVFFSKVDSVLKNFNKQDIFADVTLKLLKEESPNIEDAVREFIEKENQPILIETIKEHPDVSEKLRQKLIEKQKQIDSLQDQTILLSKALNETRKEIKYLKDRKSEIVKNDGGELKSSVDFLKKLRRLEMKGYHPVIEIDEINGDLIETLDERIDLHDRIIFTNEMKNLNLLNSKEIKCLITFEELEESEIERLEFPVVQIDESSLENFNDIKAIKTDYIEKRLVDAKKSGLVGWLKGYRKRKD